MPPRRPHHRSRQSAKKRQPRGSFWRALFWLFLGFTGGVGTAAFVAATINKMPIPFSEPTTRGGIDGSDDLQKSRRDTLDFHETLKQKQEPAAFESEETTTEPRAFVYYLQIAAYSNRTAAEEVRVQFSLEGKEVSLRPTKDSNGKDIFRVWLGPYTSRDTAESERASLAFNGYDEVQLLKLAE